MLANELIDQIYEAAFFLQFWPNVLDRPGALVEAPTALIFTSDEFHHLRWVANTYFAPPVRAYVDGGFMTRNERPGRFMATHQAGFMNDVDVMSIEKIERDPAYALFMKPVGIGCTAGIVMALPTGEILVFDFTRRLDLGPFEQRFLALLDGARPHLARAGMMATRLRMEEARTIAKTLAILGLAGAVVSPNGRLLAANDSFSALAPQVVIGPGISLRFGTPEADQLLQECLGYPAAVNVIRSIAVPPSGNRAAYALHLLHIRGAALDVFSNAATLAVASPPGKLIAPAANLLNSLFDLTPAEARVTRLLCAGKSVKRIVTELSVSQETVHAQLKRVMAKTGTKRQAELVSLLAGASTPAGSLAK